MEKEFIPYEQTLALQELEFDKEIIMGYYRGNRLVDLVEYKFTIENYPHINFIPTLLYQQAFRWFREKYKLDPTIKSWTENNKIVYYISTEPIGKPSRYKCYEVKKDSYEEAELECLKKLIEIVKNK